MADPGSTLLIVHHTPSPTMAELFEATVAGTRAEGLEGVTVVTRPALSAGPADVLAAGAVLLGTSANIGYMSGALKHFFDQCYYPCLGATDGLPFGLYVHGNNDVTGAATSVLRICGALGWRQAHPVVELVGDPDRNASEACWELGATLAATLLD